MPPTRQNRGGPLSPPPKGRPDLSSKTRSITMVAFAKRIVDLYVQGASRYLMPFIWSL